MTATIRDTFGSALPLLVILVVGLLVMPIAQWGTGQSGFMSGIILGVLLQTTIGVLFLAQAAGTRRVVGIVLIVLAVAWAAEFIGSATTVPFGGYGYTSKLQPQLLGVPLLVPLAWLMMLPPAWAVAQRITGRVSGVAFVAVSALAFTAWDFYLDPQMVHWGLWVWDVSGPYFGIPLANFAGWLLISALITALVRPSRAPADAAHRHLRPGLAHRGDWPGVRLGAARPGPVRLHRHGRVRGAGVADGGCVSA